MLLTLWDSSGSDPMARRRSKGSDPGLPPTRPTAYCLLRLRHQRVTGAADSANGIAAPGCEQGLAQAADVNVDGAVVDVDVVAPDVVQQLLAREHPAGRAHQELQQAIIRRP